MNHYLKTSAIVILSSLALSACSDKEEEIKISLNEIPTNIIDIVQNTLPGITLTDAEKEIKNKTVIYKLEGKLINGKEYEIKIAEDSTIIEIELED